MDDVHLGQLLRAARIRKRWRQVDVARRGGVSDQTISRLERGQLEVCSLAVIRRTAAILEVRIEISGRWRGAAGETLIAARHDALAETATRYLQGFGWELRPEVSFSIYGERGGIDLLAWHPPTRSLLVVELKTAIVDVGELLGTLDRKRRLGARIATDLGWRAATVSSCLIVTEGRTNRRRVAAHSGLVRAALPASGRELRAWLSAPAGPLDALTFLPVRHGTSIRRVTRAPATAATAHGRRTDVVPSGSHARVMGQTTTRRT
jgi:transcriptional regulator with XRE-family HTH domain